MTDKSLNESTRRLERMQAEYDARIDISEHVKAICEKLGIETTYVAQLDIRPDTVEALLYRGRDGSGQGAKFIYDEGSIAMELQTFKVRS